jgi:hypothetical protein
LKIADDAKMPVKFCDVQQRFLDVGLLVRDHVVLITGEEEVKDQREKNEGRVKERL